LIDIRHEPQKIDLEFMQWMGENGIPFAIIFTKADKLKASAVAKKPKEYLKQMTDTIWEEAPPHFVTSASKRIGRAEVLNFIAGINDDFQKNQR